MNTKTCSKCKQELPLSKFYKHRVDGKEYTRPQCTGCHNSNSMARRDADPRYRLWRSSKNRALRDGIAHTIKPEDIPLPESCRYLGISIDYRCAQDKGQKRSNDSPNIDRINPQIGYVPGNIQVISDLANRMKTDATVEQLLTFARAVFVIHG